MTGGETFKFGDLWASEKDNIRFQLTAMLIRRLEEGMASNEWERGYRTGLNELPRLWASCFAQIAKEREKSETTKKVTEKKLKRRSKLV